jgi:hypothetical protein
MKGLLYKTETNKWFVNHDGKIIPLHPEINLEPTPFNNYGDGYEVNFIIVDEFSNPDLFQKTGWGDGTECAWLVNEIKEQEMVSEINLESIKILEKKFPNDMDFGRMVRKLLNKIKK